MKRLIIALLLLTACSPKVYVGYVVEKDIFARRVTVEINEYHYVVAVSEDVDTLIIGDLVTIQVKGLTIIK